MSVLSGQELSKSYGERVLLDRVSVTIADGERVGVVGRNGAGKSTLAKILAGAEPADGGTIAVRRGARVAYLAQEPVLDGTRTVRDVVEEGLAASFAARRRHEELSQKIATGDGDVDALVAEQHDVAAEIERLGGWDRSHEVERVLEKLGASDVIDRAAGQLSGGQRRRVALAQVLVGAPDVMILDEPTNHLDADTIDWLERHLAEEYRGAVLLVTHDRWLLDRVADRTLEVERGALYSYDGGYAEYLGAKAERLVLAERTERNRQNFLRKELDWLARQPKARTTKQKSRIGRAEAARDIQVVRDDGPVVLSADVAEVGRSILDLRGITLKVPGGERVLVKGFDLALTSGDRLGILGPNGAGKTTLLRVINGELPPAEGAITLGRRVRIGYLDQQRATLDPELSVLEQVSRSVPTVEKDRVDPRTYLERFNFEGSAQKKKIGALSGGERARVALAMLLASACNLLLLDEPTNDLDTDTLSALEDFLSTYEGSILVVTHDRYFLDRVTNGMLYFEGDGRVTRYAGSYQAYAATRAREAEQKPKAVAPVAKPKAERPKNAGLSKNEQKELDGIMDRIDEAERTAAAVEAELGDPTLYTTADDGRAKAIRGRLEEARAVVAKLTARWEELEAKKEA
jgi:ABC transport system ATP-binding/permease protein